MFSFCRPRSLVHPTFPVVTKFHRPSCLITFLKYIECPVLMWVMKWLWIGLLFCTWLLVLLSDHGFPAFHGETTFPWPPFIFCSVYYVSGTQRHALVAWWYMPLLHWFSDFLIEHFVIGQHMLFMIISTRSQKGMPFVDLFAFRYLLLVFRWSWVDLAA